MIPYRKTIAATQSLACDGGGLCVIPANPHRIALTCSLAGGAAFNWGFGTIQGGGFGVRVPTGVGFVKLTIDEMGDAIRDTIFISGGAGLIFIYLDVMEAP